jgi:hypothetical protein
LRYSGRVADRARPNSHNWKVSRQGLLEINKILLENPYINPKCIKNRLNLVASVRTFRRYIKMLGWRKVESKYCQVVSFENRVKRYVFGCFCKIFNEKFDDVICSDETTCEIRLSGYKNYRKSSSDILRAVGGKIGKHKHSNIKIH